MIALGVLNRWGQETKEAAPLFGQEISEIKISETFGQGYEMLKKAEKGWMVDDAEGLRPADEETVNSLVGQLAEIKLDNLVAENKDNFKNLGIGISGSVMVEINGQILEIGNVTKMYDGSYVKPKNEEKVYKVNTAIYSGNLAKPEYWSKRFLVSLPVSQVKKFTIERYGKTETIEPGEGKWPNSDRISLAANLKAGKYLKDFKPSNADKMTISVETDKEKEKVIMGKEIFSGKTVWWVTREETYYYEIERKDFDLLTVGRI